VAAGTPTVSKGTFTQRRYAEGGHDAKPSHPTLSASSWKQIRRYRGQVTDRHCAPLMNVGLPSTKIRPRSQAQRVVIMVGSIKRRLRRSGSTPPRPPQPNELLNDIPSAQKPSLGSAALRHAAYSTPIEAGRVTRGSSSSQGTPLTPMPLRCSIIHGAGNADSLDP